MEENPYQSPPSEPLETKKRMAPPLRSGRRTIIALLFIGIGFFCIHEGIKRYPEADVFGEKYPQVRDAIRQECVTESMVGIGLALSGGAIWFYRPRFKAKK